MDTMCQLSFFVLEVNLYFFIAYLQKCNEINETNLGNIMASNFSSSFRPRDLGGSLHAPFTMNITKTHSHYPITLNGQTRKI